ncbi:DUF2274 domain-containing protein [Methylosinus sporium]|jgi:hypothetical protein|uniref:DUF2274 domain-containing protein n=1 Tax=Methylosinus sporium TaxID=428 RepID=UPI000D59C6E5|nr:DUF2274 domain-containing protein [Methylosinus sporium]PWB88854.1 DUF2274 domain-containing protein [Methylocystis sp. MitZ-2018]
MTKLKLNSIQDDKPIKLTVALPAALHRDLIAYSEILAEESGQKIEPAKLIAPMLEKFIAGDRGFAKARGSRKMAKPSAPASPSTSSAPD